MLIYGSVDDVPGWLPLTHAASGEERLECTAGPPDANAGPAEVVYEVTTPSLALRATPSFENMLDEDNDKTWLDYGDEVTALRSEADTEGSGITMVFVKLSRKYQGWLPLADLNGRKLMVKA